jgi:hypothetical protein
MPRNYFPIFEGNNLRIIWHLLLWVLIADFMRFRFANEEIIIGFDFL